MLLEKCYEILEGDLQDVLHRIPNEQLVVKFVKKFLAEPSYGNLCHGLENQNYEEAFRAAHSLKGVCQNLAFSKLEKSSSELTEYLRNYKTEKIDKAQWEGMLESVSNDYKQTIGAIETCLEE